MKTISLPPYAPTLIESTRSIGYSLESAVADIIDNSISAGASKIDINYFPGSNPSISILDNGSGMNQEEIDTAMRYGSYNPEENREEGDLGRYGLGLKTASLSQCRCLTVVSKQGRHFEGRRWDLDHIAETQDWSCQILEPKDRNLVPDIELLRKHKTGTLVVWEKLDKMKEGEISFNDDLSKLMDRVREHLSLVFHRYLSGEPELKSISIFMNGRQIKPKDPFLIKKSTKTMEPENISLHGETVTITPYLLPHISRMSREEIESLGGKEGLTKNQGFYVYRNKRLIVWGTWFRMARASDITQLARIQVDIPNTLDSLWTLDVKKSTAQPPAEIKRNLENVVRNLTEKSRRTYSTRAKKELEEQSYPLWERMQTRTGENYLQISREHPLIQVIQKKMGRSSGQLEALLRLLESNIPYNQIYMDLSSGSSLSKPEDEDSREIEKQIRAALKSVKDPDLKKVLLESLEYQDPFKKYPSLIQKLKKET